jgi:hypothetical protein
MAVVSAAVLLMPPMAGHGGDTLVSAFIALINKVVSGESRLRDRLQIVYTLINEYVSLVGYVNFC